MKIIKHFLWINVLLLSACTTVGQPAANAEISTYQSCPEQRAQMCTLDYNPVCGVIDARPTFDLKTYSNACSACSDEKVVAYMLGDCNSQ